MKHFFPVIFILFSYPVSAQPAAVLLDNFNRNDSVKVGVPAGSTYEYWLEYGEVSCPSAIRIHNNAFEMSKNAVSGSTCYFSNAKAANIEMTYKYSTTFANAPGKLEWYFNMQTNVSDPTGFNNGQVGAAFVVGCTTSDPFNNPSGYAVVYGDAADDRVRLVWFTGSFSNGSMSDIVSVPAPANKTDHMSIRVTFDPCTGEWSLRMRNDGSSFANPSTITGEPESSEKAVNTFLTSTNLPWIGGIWNHGSSAGIVKFDNVYIPDPSASAPVYTWTGASGTDFQDASNWNPVRSCIRSGDKLSIDGTSPVNSVLTNVPTQSIGQLYVTGNRNVILKDAGNSAANTITLVGGAGYDLFVESGSTLSLDVSTTSASDALILNLASGATALISGTLNFQNTQTGSGSPHRLLGLTSNAVTVGSGGVIRAVNLAGNPFGSSGNTNIVLFQSGSVYEYQTGGDPFGFSAPSSKVVFNRGSLYRHLSNEQPVLFGRTYSNFEFSGNCVIINGADGSAWNVDTMRITGGAFELIGAFNNQQVNLNVRGDMYIAPGAFFNYDPADSSALTFNSNFAAQNLYNKGDLILGKNLTVRLNSNFSVPQLTVRDEIKIAGELMISSGTLHLEDDIHLLSDAVKTAYLSRVFGSITYGAGRFVVERFLEAHRAWRLLSVPTKGSTINQSWQEGNVPMGNNSPGYGTLITSPGGQNGFDMSSPGPSMKSYNVLGNTWTAMNRTDTLLDTKRGYMLFVRGDRSVAGYNDPPGSTILRSRGKLYVQGSEAPPTSTIHAGRFEVVGNPYASAINFNLLSRTGGVQNAYYLWDPKLGGTHGVGGYQYFEYNGSGYDVLPGGGSYSQGAGIIQSGQAFLAVCISTVGIIAFNETAKTNGSRLVNRPPVPSSSSLRIYLQKNNIGETILLDGVRSLFSNQYAGMNEVSIPKAGQSHESISVLKNGEKFISERRRLHPVRDSISLHIERLSGTYQLVIYKDNINQDAWLEDTWLNTRVFLGADSTVIPFAANVANRSSLSTRFRIVFGRWVQDAVNPFVVYPNPLPGDVINVSGKNPGDKIELVDLNGRVLRHFSLGKHQGLLIPGLKPGVYYLRSDDVSVPLIKL